MRSIQELERIVGPRKSKPKIVEDENPKSYITSGIDMAIGHIINLDRERSHERASLEISNLKNGLSLRNHRVRVSTATLNRRRYKHRGLDLALTEAVPNLGWETTQTINLLLKKTRSKMDLL